MYTNILIATDGSDLADKAVAQGLAFAEALGSSVIVVTITESLSASEIAAQAEAGNVNVLDNYNTRAKEGAQKILSAAASTAHEMGVNCETIHVPDRHPAEGIIAGANDKGCDLIIMASHGHRGIKKVLLGSVANEVLTHSTKPVLIFR